MTPKINHSNLSFLDNHRRQFFCLPRDVISHITRNPCSAKGLLKLQKTCKYFFALKKIVVVENFELKEKQCAFLKNENKKFWLTNNDFTMVGPIRLNFFKILYRCDIKNLKIYKQNFTLNEINLFLNGGKIELLWLRLVIIRGENGNLVPINKILEKVPNISNFDYVCRKEVFTNETFEIMNALKFNSKLKRFYIAMYQINDDIDFSILCDFIKKNATEKTTLLFTFHCVNLKYFKKVLSNDFKKEFHDWKLRWKFQVQENYISFNY